MRPFTVRRPLKSAAGCGLSVFVRGMRAVYIQPRGRCSSCGSPSEISSSQAASQASVLASPTTRCAPNVLPAISM